MTMELRAGNRHVRIRPFGPQSVVTIPLAIVLTLAIAVGIAAAQPDVSWNRLPDGPHRLAHGMIHDVANDLYWQYGGVTANRSGDFSDDLWRLDPSEEEGRWERVPVAGLRPPPLALMSATYDPVRDRMLIYGGIVDDDPTLTDPKSLWSLDLSDPASVSWQRESIAGNAAPRFGHAAVYVEEHDALVVSGGFVDFNDPRGDHWALLLGEDPPQWVRLANAGFFPRGGHALIYDGPMERLVAFGGSAQLQADPTNNMDALDLSAGLDVAERWSRINPQTPITARSFMATGWDPDRRLWWMQGGFVNNRVLRELKVADMNPDRPIWTNTLEVYNGPLERFWHASLWDGSRDRMVVHGGGPAYNQVESDTRAMEYALAPTATGTLPTTTTTSTSTATVTMATTVTPGTATPTGTATATPTPSVTVDPDGTGTTTPTTIATQPDDVEIEIEGFTFVPSVITITVGTSVRWINRDDVPHTTTSGAPGNPDGQWDSGFLQSGDSFTRRFDEVGTFDYFCRVHPSMLGRVVVVDRAAPSATVGAPTGTATVPTGTPVPSATNTPSTPETQHSVFLPALLRTAQIRTEASTATPTSSASPTSGAPPTAAPTSSDLGRIEIEHHYGGSAAAVAIAGDIAWLAVGTEVRSVSFADGAPSTVGRTQGLGDIVRHVMVDGGYLWVGTERGLVSVDITDPSEPTLAGRWLVGRPVRGLAAGSTGPIVGTPTGVVFLDVAPDGTPDVDEELDTVSVRDLATDSERLFVATSDGVTIFDVSTPGSSVELGSYDAEARVEGITTHEGRLVLALGREGVRSVDVTNIAAPQEIGTVATEQSALAVASSERGVAAALGRGGIAVISVPVDAPPIVTDTVADGTLYTVDVAWRGDMVWAADEGGLLALDAAEAGGAVIVEHLVFAGRATELAVAGDVAFAGFNRRGLHAVRSEPSEDLQLLGVLDDLRVDALHASGPQQLLVGRNVSLHIVDVGNPAAPQERGSVAIGVNPGGIDALGTTAYVAGYGGDLIAVDIADPDAPTVQGRLELGDRAQDVALSPTGEFAVVAVDDGVALVDVRTPAAMTVRGRLQIERTARSVTVVGERAWVGSDSTLRGIDVRDPDAPTTLGEIGGLPDVYDLVIDGDMAWLATGRGVHVVDIATPSAPLLVARGRPDVRQFAIVGLLSGERALTAGDAGLLAVRIAFD